jgi:hypothetical protein
MTRPTIGSGDSYSFSEMLVDFGNASYTPHRLSDYYGAESSSWTDPDAPQPVSGKLVCIYTPNGNGYRGDYQIDSIAVTGTVSYTFDSSVENWGYISYTSGTVSQIANGYTGSSTYSAITTGTASYKWNRDSGNTPSSNTGITMGTYFIYAETSNNSRIAFVARSPSFDMVPGSHTLTATVGSYGANIGACYFYWMPDTVTSGNMTDKLLIGTDPQASQSGSQSLSFNFSI